MQRHLLLTLIPSLLALASCKDLGLYCDEVTPCADRFPDKPFCDVHGSTEESEGIRNTCTAEEPIADAGTVDAPVTTDAGPDANLCAPISDGFSCTTDTCDSQGNQVHTPNDADCDNGLFCDGEETCSTSSGCVAGPAPDCPVSCNAAANRCNECVPNSSVCANGTRTDCGPDGLVSSIQPCEGPSCAGLSTTCGSGGNENCCASAVVPGGTYYRSYDIATDAWNDMSYPATVSEFWLDTYEITVGRFRKFVDAGKGTQAQPPVGGSGAHAEIAGSGWSASWNSSLSADTAGLKAGLQCNSTYQTWTDTAGANEHRPINCITWYEAMAFCIWDGGYLPTEAEWNDAATGGNQQRAYPWSSPASSTTIDATYVVYSGSGSTANVGSKSPKGDGRWGQTDLAGNVREWTLDWFASLYSNPCSNCANLATTSTRVIRGGSFDFDASYVRTAYRFNLPPPNRDWDIGARCARTP